MEEGRHVPKKRVGEGSRRLCPESGIYPLRRHRELDTSVSSFRTLT
jgi:hypothetical protein